MKYDSITVLLHLSDRVDEAFIAACLYLKDHMDEMANLNADMVIFLLSYRQAEK